MGKRFWILLGAFVAAMMWAFLDKSCNLPILGYTWMGLGADKVAHALYMGALATLMSQRWGMWRVVLLCSGLAIGVEFLQPYFHRSFNLSDAAWGMLGAWFAWGLYQTKWYRRVLEHKLF